MRSLHKPMDDEGEIRGQTPCLYTAAEFKALRFAVTREMQRERSPWEFYHNPDAQPQIYYRPFVQTGEETWEGTEEAFIIIIFYPPTLNADEGENRADFIGWYQTRSMAVPWLSSDQLAYLRGQLEMLAFGYVKYGRITDEGKTWLARRSE